jgi:hypothetical protein
MENLATWFRKGVVNVGVLVVGPETQDEPRRQRRQSDVSREDVGQGVVLQIRDGNVGRHADNVRREIGNARDFVCPRQPLDAITIRHQDDIEVFGRPPVRVERCDNRKAGACLVEPARLLDNIHERVGPGPIANSLKIASKFRGSHRLRAAHRHHTRHQRGGGRPAQESTSPTRHGPPPRGVRITPSGL